MVLEWVEGGEYQAPAAECHACPPGKETQHTLCMKLDRLQVKKILLPLVLEPQTAQTMVSHYTMFSRLPHASGYYKVTDRSGGYGN